MAKKIVLPEDYKGLGIKHISEASNEALDDINLERSGEQIGLYSEWRGMNKAMGKYWRFNHITQIAAPSGHGKSYGINQLHDHFTDFEDILNPDGTVYKTAINGEFKGEVVVVHFGLEMDASDEVIRNLSRKVGKSHNYMLSGEWNKDLNTYNQIDDKEYSKIANRINYIKNKPIYYIEMTGTTVQMYYTVLHIQNMHPKAKLVISIDHTLLVKRGASEANDGDLIRAVAVLCLRLRKEFKAMVIPISQLNQNIKNVERLTNPSLHYPMDSDIYQGSQINWVCDNIWIFPYRPILFNITRYGLDKIDTNGLVIASCIKSRKGKILEVHLNEHLAVGMFTERANVTD